MIEDLLNDLGAGPKLALVVDFKMKVVLALKFPTLQQQVFLDGFFGGKEDGFDGGKPFLEPGQRAIVDLFPLINDKNPFTETLDVLHVMGCYQEGGLVCLVHVADKGADSFLDTGIQADGRLIQKDNGRLVDKNGCKFTANPLAQGQIADGLLHDVCQIQQID